MTRDFDGAVAVAVAVAVTFDSGPPLIRRASQVPTDRPRRGRGMDAEAFLSRQGWRFRKPRRNREAQGTGSRFCFSRVGGSAGACFFGDFALRQRKLPVQQDGTAAQSPGASGFSMPMHRRAIVRGAHATSLNDEMLLPWPLTPKFSRPPWLLMAGRLERLVRQGHFYQALRSWGICICPKPMR